MFDQTYDWAKPFVAEMISPFVPSRADDRVLDFIFLLLEGYTSLASSACTCEPFVECTTDVFCEQDQMVVS